MKFKYKIDKKTGETIINYMKEKDIHAFRRNVLSIIFNKGFNDITIIIDNNRCINPVDADSIQTILKSADITYHMIMIEAHKKPILGFNVNALSKKKVYDQACFIIDLATHQFTPELFEKVLSHYDIAIGLDRKQDFDAICTKTARMGLESLLFNDQDFVKCVYDGYMFSMLRTDVDIEKELDQYKGGKR